MKISGSLIHGDEQLEVLVKSENFVIASNFEVGKSLSLAFRLDAIDGNSSFYLFPISSKFLHTSLGSLACLHFPHLLAANRSFLDRVTFARYVNDVIYTIFIHVFEEYLVYTRFLLTDSRSSLHYSKRNV